MQDSSPSNPKRSLVHIFTDSLWQRLSRYRHYGEIDGVKIGVVLATKNPRFDNWALNQTDFYRVIAGLRDGRIDEAYVVAAKVNSVGVPRYCDQIEAEELHRKLANEEPRIGAYGAFYVIGAHVWDPNCEDEPF
jgi:hypothetical protein